MQYAGIIKNDLAAAPGISVTFFTQGCPHHCPGCHNPETWDFAGGKEFTFETLTDIIAALKANGIQRSLSIMGGEPLCEENQFLTYMVVDTIKQQLPDTKIYIWTGYYLSELQSTSGQYALNIKRILDLTDVIVDGRYVAEERDITLPMRGSRNQHILYKGKDF